MSDLNIFQNEQVRDAERAVLGGLMLETSRFDTVIQIIKDVDFDDKNFILEAFKIRMSFYFN